MRGELKGESSRSGPRMRSPTDDFWNAVERWRGGGTSPCSSGVDESTRPIESSPPRGRYRGDGSVGRRRDNSCQSIAPATASSLREPSGMILCLRSGGPGSGRCIHRWSVAPSTCLRPRKGTVASVASASGFGALSSASTRALCTPPSFAPAMKRLPCGLESASRRRVLRPSGGVRMSFTWSRAPRATGRGDRGSRGSAGPKRYDCSCARL
eukprot:Amastigsp_a345709_57.p2 type:complete len:211 gc:universal Amastigsp_a345709_57:508-1140(+)